MRANLIRMVTARILIREADSGRGQLYMQPLSWLFVPGYATFQKPIALFPL